MDAVEPVEKEKEERMRYNYALVVRTDIPDGNRRKEMVEICQIACEKFAAVEKTPLERNNEAAAHMIKVRGLCSSVRRSCTDEITFSPPWIAR